MQHKSEIEFVYSYKYYFYPNFYSFNWDSKTLKILDRQFIKSFKKLAYYMPFMHKPNILFVHINSDIKVKNALDIDYNIDAITYKTNIIIFCNSRIKSIEDIFKHELFHIGVNQGPNKEKEIIPLWFNEAIAHYLGNNHFITNERISSILKDQLNEIKQSIYDDRLVNGHKYWIELIKSIGSFFFNTYSKRQLKNFLKKTATSSNFSETFNNYLGVEIDEFINSWARWIVNKDNFIQKKYFFRRSNNDKKNFIYLNNINLFKQYFL